MSNAQDLNLNKNSVNYYWQSLNPKMAKILSMMESVEPWVVDDIEEVSKRLIEFGKLVSQTEIVQLSQSSEEITVLMAYIYSSKSLRLLNWIDENHPGLSFHYVMEARHKSDWEQGKLLLDRLKTIKSISLLGHIFSPTRTKLISGLLEEDDEED